MPPRPGLPGPGLPGPGPTQEHINNIDMIPTQTSAILNDNFLEPIGHSKFSELPNGWPKIIAIFILDTFCFCILM